MTFLLNNDATAWARARHAAGRDLLNLIFGWDEFSGDQATAARLERMDPLERARRRRKTRAQRKARRRNRS